MFCLGLKSQNYASENYITRHEVRLIPEDEALDTASRHGICLPYGWGGWWCTCFAGHGVRGSWGKSRILLLTHRATAGCNYSLMVMPKCSSECRTASEDILWLSHICQSYIVGAKAVYGSQIYILKILTCYKIFQKVAVAPLSTNRQSHSQSLFYCQFYHM